MDMHLPHTGHDDDVHAFEILVREHHLRVRAYAFTLCRNDDTADDITQDAFVTAYQKIATFNTKRDFGTWVRGIVRFKYLQHISKHKEMPVEAVAIDILDNRYAGIDEAERVHNAHLFGTVTECIAALDNESRMMIERRYYKNMTSQEISSITHLASATIRKRLERIRLSIASCVRLKLRIESI